MREVCVLMSTYNGEKYIDEQVTSIMNQKGVKVTLIIRDDFSIDSTIDRLKILQRQFDNILIIEGKENIGWRDSFLTLLYYVKRYSFHYYAFSDQDDIWLENKLVSACNMIDKVIEKKPLLYISDRTIVNMNGQKLYEICEDKKFIHDGTGKKMVLMDENVVSVGCVQVFNRELLNLVTYSSRELVIRREISHDHWTGLIALYFGEIVYENQSYILHRQHPESITNNGIKHKKKIWKSHTNYAKTFYNFFAKTGKLSEKDIKFLMLIGGDYKKSFINKAKIILDPELRYKTILGTLRFKTEILLSKI